MLRTISPGRDLSIRLRAHEPLLLDGALGTELERRGIPLALPLWSAHALLTRPDAVRAVHRDYVEAGVECLTANTFRTQARTLARAGLGAEAGRLTALAIRLARESVCDATNAANAAAQVFVLGSAPPLEDCFRPELAPDDATLALAHRAHAQALAAGGADGILCETHNSLREACAAARAARQTGLPVWVSFVCRDGPRLLSGDGLADALAAVAAFHPQMVLVNCLPAAEVAVCLPLLRASGLPFGVYANVGFGPGATPDPDPRDAPTPEGFATAAAGWVRGGSRVVGGCCGTQPAHLRAVRERLRRMPGDERTQNVSPPTGKRPFSPG